MVTSTNWVFSTKCAKCDQISPIMAQALRSVAEIPCSNLYTTAVVPCHLVDVRYLPLLKLLDVRKCYNRLCLMFGRESTYNEVCVHTMERSWSIAIIKHYGQYTFGPRLTSGMWFELAILRFYARSVKLFYVECGAHWYPGIFQWYIVHKPLNHVAINVYIKCDWMATRG